MWIVAPGPAVVGSGDFFWLGDTATVHVGRNCVVRWRHGQNGSV